MSFTDGKLVRVSLVATKSGRSQVNTFHYSLSDGFLGDPDNSPQALADWFRDHVRGDFAGAFPSAWQIQPVNIIEEKDPLNPTAPRSEWTSGGTIAGTGDSSVDLLPSGCCTVVKLTSEHVGKRHTGRCFIGGVRTESNQANGIWSSAVITAVTAYMNHVPKQPDIADGISLAEANWVVYSRTARAANQTPYVSRITGFTVRPEVHYLRSRANQ